MSHAGDGGIDEGRPVEPDAAAVRAQLERVLQDPAFKASDRSRAFLRFIVAETLAGRGDRIKAFTLAVEVFGRDHSFAVQGDPVVRLEAGRLRRALQHYYLTEGRDDPVEITIAKGGYRPSFVARAARTESPPVAPTAAPGPVPVRPWRSPRLIAGAALLSLALLVAGLASLSWLTPPDRGGGALFRPAVLVVPFAERGTAPAGKELALGVTDQLVAELTRFREITVYGRAWPGGTGDATTPQQRARELGATHVLDGSVTATPERVRVHVHLDSAADGATVWSATYDRDLRAADLFAVQDQIAAEVATRIAQPFGELARAMPHRGGHPDDLEAYRCGIAFYAYRRNFTRDDQPKVVACLEHAVARHPDYATGWAMLALARIDSDRFGFPAQAGGPTPLESAAAAARQAIALDPNDVRAWQALMLASYLRSDVAEGRAAGERALALNPNDLELVGEFGMRLAMAGEWERGTAMIRSVVDRDPAGARFHLSVLAPDSFRRGRYEEAIGTLDRMQPVNVPTSDLVRAAALGQLGRTAEARAAGERVLQALPGFFDRLEAEFAKRNLQPDVRRALIAGWLKAGLPVPDAGTRAAPAPSVPKS